MTDGQLLFLALAAIYLAECVFLLRGRGVAFLRPWGGAWRFCAEGGIGTANAAILLRNPLPPLGSAVLCDASPVAFSAEGAAATGVEAVSRRGRGHGGVRTLAWAEVRSAGRDGRTLLLNGRPFAEFATDAAAEAHAELAGELAAAPVGRRERQLRDFVRRRFRTSADERRAAEGLKEGNGYLATLCNCLFLWLFLALPASCLALGTGRVLLSGVLTALAISAVAIPAFWWRRHRALLPQARAKRWLTLAMAVVCPPAAIRIQDSLETERLAGLHPLAAGALLLDAAAFRTLAGRWFRDLRHPAAPASGESPAADKITAFWRKLLLDETERFLRQERLEPAALLAAPEPQPGCTSYCPRCLSQYLESAAECADCGGLPLKPFEGDAGGLEKRKTP